MQEKKIGIIGFGRFGKLIARILKSKFADVHILAFAWKRKKLGISQGVEFTTLNEVCNSDVVIPCVPISSFEEVSITTGRSLVRSSSRKRRNTSRPSTLGSFKSSKMTAGIILASRLA